MVEGLDSDKWYVRNSILGSLANINMKNAMPYIIEATKDDNTNVRRNAVFLLLKYPSHEAIEPLQMMLDDEDFETRFYAKQAIKLIEETK